MTATVGRGEVDYRLDPNSGSLGFLEGQQKVAGLPTTIRVGVDYPVRILVPSSEPGSRLVFTLLDRGDFQLKSPRITLCAEGSGPPDASSCRVDKGSAFGYTADGVRELPAVLRFSEKLAGRTLRMQFQVLGPQSPWIPFGDRRERLYIVGDITPDE